MLNKKLIKDFKRQCHDFMVAERAMKKKGVKPLLCTNCGGYITEDIIEYTVCRFGCKNLRVAYPRVLKRNSYCSWVKGLGGKSWGIKQDSPIGDYYPINQYGEPEL